MAPEWMNWDGWRWIGLLGAYALGHWQGWSNRAVLEAHRRLRAAQAELRAEIRKAVEDAARGPVDRTEHNGGPQP